MNASSSGEDRQQHLISDKDAEGLISRSLEAQKQLRDKLQSVNATTLNPEEIADYSFCLNKNFVAIRNLENAELSKLIDSMTKNEDEIQDGIENLKGLIENARNQAAVFSVIDRIIAIVVRVVKIFTP
jgi:ADP-dependent phosphofructokinase/glucokinase